MAKKPTIEEMVKWFLERYEGNDNVPHNGEAGGYQYGAGGPYEPSHVLQEKFPSADLDDVEKAAEEIDKDDITVWVRKGDY